MSFELFPHPDTPTDVVRRVDVAVHRGAPERLTLTCGLDGDVSRIRIPRAEGQARGHELWKHTCYEMFVRAEGDGYYEFNFSPSLRWAAYRFSGYRTGMVSVSPAKISGLGIRKEAGSLGGYVELDLSGLPGLDLSKPLKIGLSAVIEEMDGRKSYWALAHPPGKPDFHHPVAFARDVATVVYW